MRELGKENGMETEVSIRSIKGRESTYVCLVNDTLCFQDSSKVCLTQLQQLLTPPKKSIAWASSRVCPCESLSLPHNLHQA